MTSLNRALFALVMGVLSLFLFVLLFGRKDRPVQ